MSTEDRIQLVRFRVAKQDFAINIFEAERILEFKAPSPLPKAPVFLEGVYAHYYLGLVYSEREMHGDAQTFFRKTLKLGPNLIEAYYELGWSEWYAADRDAAQNTWADGYAANKFNPWGKRCKEALETIEQGQEPRHF